MASSAATRPRRVAVAFVATGTAMAITALTLIPSANASSHREAPLIAADPTVDNTDVWAFTSPDRKDTVTLIANWAPLSEPNGGPTFYPWAEGAHYDINIDNDGDAEPDLIYRWVFKTDDRRDNTFLYNIGRVTTLDDEDLLFRQTYDLTVIDDKGHERILLDDALSAPSNTGAASMPDYASLTRQAIMDLPSEGKAFAGQSDESFFLDLRVFDLLYGGNLTEIGQDTLDGYNSNTLAIQVPKSELALGGNPVANPVIGIWSDTEKQSMRLSPGESNPIGKHVQVSRLGSPLINEVVVPASRKDIFNSSEPVSDADNKGFLDRVRDPEVPRLIQRIYGLPAPETPREDLVELFLTGITDKTGDQINIGPLNSQLDNADVNPVRFKPSDQLRLNMSTPVTLLPNRLGVVGGDRQGYPNGRRLADDIVDIEVLAFQGALRRELLSIALIAGDLVNVNDKPFMKSFPYVATANNQAVNSKLLPIPPVVPNNIGIGGAWLPIQLGTGLGALVLVGTGAWMLRRRPALAPVRSRAIPAVD